MALNKDQAIVARVMDLLVFVNPALLHRNATDPLASQTRVHPKILSDIEVMIERAYPGVLDRVRDGYKCERCSLPAWRYHDRSRCEPAT